MDVVKALNRYRKSIIDDEVAFTILCLLCKEGATSEPEIARSTETSFDVIKRILRELYQADFIRIEPAYQFALTSFGEEVLSRMGVSEVVTPFLIDDLISGESAETSRQVAELAFDAEPQRARLSMQSLRNLRVFISRLPAVTEKMKLFLVYDCITPSSSTSRALLERQIANWVDGADRSGILLLHGESGTGKSRLNLTNELRESLDHLSTVSAAYADVFVNACRSNIADRQIDDDVRVFLSFKIYNYINSDERDGILEYCVPRIYGNNRVELHNLMTALLPHTGGDWVEKEWFSTLSRTVAKKTKSWIRWEDQDQAASDRDLFGLVEPAPESELMAKLQRVLEDLKKPDLSPERRERERQALLRLTVALLHARTPESEDQP